MKAESPFDGRIYYFIDKCLPFGVAISCAHFQAFLDAIAHIVKFKTKQENVNYLDDFLFIALMMAFCNAQVEYFLQVCELIRFLVSLEKTCFGTTCIVFLGMLIDTVAQLVMVPHEKIEKGKAMISHALNKQNNKITVKQCQKICGFLNFLGRAIVPGRAFTRRLYAYTSGKKLKPHHHIRLTTELKADLGMWLQFLHHQSVYVRGFMDFSESIVADQISMFSDASKIVDLGFGGVCTNSWLYGQWDREFMKNDPSIAYLELYALVATVLTWIHRYQNRRVILFCDNQSVVQMVNITSSSCKNCMVLIRILVLKCLEENVRIFARYIRSKDNTASDYLSRLKIDAFKRLKDSWDEFPTEIPSRLTPINKLWIK